MVRSLLVDEGGAQEGSLQARNSSHFHDGAGARAFLHFRHVCYAGYLIAARRVSVKARFVLTIFNLTQVTVRIGSRSSAERIGAAESRPTATAASNQRARTAATHVQFRTWHGRDDRRGYRGRGAFLSDAGHRHAVIRTILRVCGHMSPHGRSSLYPLQGHNLLVGGRDARPRSPQVLLAVLLLPRVAEVLPELRQVNRQR